VSGWRVVAARRTGESHLRRGERGQDAFRAVAAGSDGATLVAAVSDGAGSAPRGGAGAALACRAATEAARTALARRPVAAVDDAEIEGWAETAARAARAAADGAGRPPRDLAATLVLAAADASGVVAVHVGDGAAAARGPQGDWFALSWPEGGDHAGETRFVTDDALAARVARAEGPATALALLTDGIERLVLDFAAGAPHAPFFERMLGPVANLARPGRDAALSRALGAYLGGEGVAARTDDDRTLLIAAPMATRLEAAA